MNIPQIKKALVIALLFGSASQAQSAGSAGAHASTKEITIATIAGRIVNKGRDSVLNHFRNQGISDPRQSRNQAYPEGVYWTSASYQWRSTHRPGMNDDQWDPVIATIDVSQGHEIDDLATISGDKDYRGMLSYRANANCWLKTYEIVSARDGRPAWTGARKTFAGTDANPFDREEAIAEIRRIHDDAELQLGALVEERTEKWTVGNYFVMSKYEQPSGNVHTELKKPGTYTARLAWKKAKVDYSGGYLMPKGEVEKMEEFFQLDCHQSDSMTFSLVKKGEMLVGGPVVSGGSDRWVKEIPNQRNCDHTGLQSHRRILTGRYHDGGHAGDSLPSPWRFPTYELAPECKEYTKIVVQESKSHRGN